MRSGGRVHIDAHELRDLEFDLSKAPTRIRNPKALRQAARIVEREMKVDAAGHVGSYFHKSKRHKDATDLPKHVSSELISPTVAEIGIENKGAGALGHLIAYGGPYNEPAYDPGAGPRRAMPRVANEMADHAEESVLGKGGGR